MKRVTRFALFVAFLIALAYLGGRNDLQPPAERPSNTRRDESKPRRAPEILPGKVVGISDGDTLRLAAAEEVIIRLEGIDAPERGQPFADAARRRLSELCYGQLAEVEVVGEDQFDRKLGVVRVAGENINAAMVRDGFAWRYLHSRDQELARLEADARRERRGLWQDRDPTPPWNYRRENPRANR